MRRDFHERHVLKKVVVRCTGAIFLDRHIETAGKTVEGFIFSMEIAEGSFINKQGFKGSGMPLDLLDMEKSIARSRLR